jgi:ribosomal protein S18 acetylase RimI-like enzyme
MAGGPLQNVVIKKVAADADLALVRELWTEYWSSLGFSADSPDFAQELLALPGVYGWPGGALLLAWVNAELAATIALRRLSDGECEVKRLYVRPAFRRSGLGRSLLERVIEIAHGQGYATVYCDTLPSMKAALGMYLDRGFCQVGPYSPDPTPGAIYLRLDLAQSGPPPDR